MAMAPVIEQAKISPSLDSIPAELSLPMAMATVIEHAKISPSPDSAIPGELSLPMSFFDMIWYDFPANQSVLFFEFPCSESHFLDTVVPELKRSLSLTLSHFLPLSGNIIHPTCTKDKPFIRYKSGDSVSFVVSKSNADFNHLTGDHPRSCDEFYVFAPDLPRATRSADSVSCPVLALQVTLLPGQGLCIGFVTHHAVADASTVVSFIRAWGIINNSPDGLDDDIRARLTCANCMPFYDREASIDIDGLSVCHSSPAEPPQAKIPVDKVRATFVLKGDEINSIKECVLAKWPDVPRLSTFTVACALVWFSTAKSAAAAGNDVADDETEYFIFAADCRARLKPPMPSNYLGNCAALLKAELKHGEVKGPEGFVKAVKAIGEAIQENVYNEKGILCGAEKWPEYTKAMGKRQYGVVGSPRFDFYLADYGWGKPKKFEALFIDDGGAFSLCKSREFDGALEIGLSKPKVQMDAFSAVFREVPSHLLQ